MFLSLMFSRLLLPARLALLIGPLTPVPGWAAVPAVAPPWDGALCDAAISRVERTARMPPSLLHAVGVAETGRAEPATTRVTPWPWSIDAEGQGRVFATKAEAIAAVQALQAAGMRSIDVGCMQINLMYHKTAFASLDDAFDPDANVVYAARFLGQLHGQSGDWRSAVGAYHSQTPGRGDAYAERVIALWPSSGRYVAPSTQSATRETAIRVAQGRTPQFRAWLAQADSDRAQLALKGVVPHRGIARATHPASRLAALPRGRDG